MLDFLGQIRLILQLFRNPLEALEEVETLGSPMIPVTAFAYSHFLHGATLWMAIQANRDRLRSLFLSMGWENFTLWYVLEKAAWWQFTATFLLVTGLVVFVYVVWIHSFSFFSGGTGSAWNVWRALSYLFHLEIFVPVAHLAAMKSLELFLAIPVIWLATSISQVAILTKFTEREYGLPEERVVLITALYPFGLVIPLGLIVFFSFL